MLSPDLWTANSAACLGVSAILSSASLSIHVGPSGHYCLVGWGRGSADAAIQTAPPFTNKKMVGKWAKWSRGALPSQTQVS